MNTNILEVATFAAIVAITWFLVSMNSIEVGSTNITNDVLNDVYEGDDKDSYTLESGKAKFDVDLVASCTGCDKDVTYFWQHEGSFKLKDAIDTTMISFRKPSETYFKYYSDDELSKMDFNVKVDKMAQSPYTGNWLPEIKGEEWESISDPVAMDNNTKKDVKVSLSAGYHAFTCKISDGEDTINDNKDGDLELFWVYVNEPDEEDVNYSFALDSNKSKNKKTRKAQSKSKPVPDTPGNNNSPSDNNEAENLSSPTN